MKQFLLTLGAILLLAGCWPLTPHLWCACADGGVGGWVGNP